MRDFEVDRGALRAQRPLGEGGRQTVRFVHDAWSPGWRPAWLGRCRSLYLCGWGPLAGAGFSAEEPSEERRGQAFAGNLDRWLAHVGWRPATVFGCHSAWAAGCARAAGAEFRDVPHYQFLLLPEAWQWRYSFAWASLKFGPGFRRLAGDELLRLLPGRGVALREYQGSADFDSASTIPARRPPSVGPKPAAAAGAAACAEDAAAGSPLPQSPDARGAAAAAEASAAAGAAAEGPGAAGPRGGGGGAKEGRRGEGRGDLP
ncbi:unnamed protein product [Prorocentrum cordatum]|nr:unnamed protein product [Polarella glacialis]